MAIISSSTCTECASQNIWARGVSPPPPAPTSIPTTSPEPAPLIEPEPSSRSNLGTSSRPLGFHRVGATSHIARLPNAQAGELLHRRSHKGVNKIRALPHTTSDAPKVLASACGDPACVSCALARIRRAPHSGTLSAPDPEPGELHFDIKEMIVSMGGYRYIVFLIDATSRFVFYDFIKNKSEAAATVLRGVAAFEATVGTPLDEDGRPRPRPRFRPSPLTFQLSP